MSRFNGPSSTKYGMKIDNHRIIQNILDQHKLEIIHKLEMIEVSPVPEEVVLPLVEPIVEIVEPIVEIVEPVVYKHRPTLMKAKSELIKIAMPL